MFTPLEHYEETLKALTGEAKDQFVLRAAFHLCDYIEEKAKPQKRKASGLRGASVVDFSNVDAAAEKYFTAVGVPLKKKREYMSRAIRKTTKRISQKLEPTASVMFEDAACCDDPEILMAQDHAVCASCGKRVKESGQFTANFADAAVAPATTLNLLASGDGDATYISPEKAHLLVEPLLRIQGIRMTAFDEKHWKKMYKAITRGVDDPSAITTAHVNRVIHNLKMMPYYKDIYVIWEKVTGKKLEIIPDAVLWAINYIIAGRLVINKDDNEDEEKKTITGAALMYKCLQLCGQKYTASLVCMLNAESCSAKLLPVWKLTCKTEGWKYYND